MILKLIWKVRLARQRDDEGLVLRAEGTTQHEDRTWSLGVCVCVLGAGMGRGSESMDFMSLITMRLLASCLFTSGHKQVSLFVNQGWWECYWHLWAFHTKSLAKCLSHGSHTNLLPLSNISGMVQIGKLGDQGSGWKGDLFFTVFELYTTCRYLLFKNSQSISCY